MRTRVKICGVTRVQDAALAVQCGADAVGFVLWPDSPRAIDVSGAAAIPTPGAFVARVGVFVNSAPDHVAAAVRRARLNAVQLHGDESVELYADAGVPVIKAMALTAAADVDRALALPPEVTVLIDASDSVRRGGTGRAANWLLARRLSDARPVILAGGLSGANISEAIEVVKPWGVDVSSGIEESPGIKSEARMRELFAALAAANQEDR